MLLIPLALAMLAGAATASSVEVASHPPTSIEDLLGPVAWVLDVASNLLPWP